MNEVIDTLPAEFQLPVQGETGKAPVAPVGSTGGSYKSDRPDTRNSKSPRKIEGLAALDYSGQQQGQNLVRSLFALGFQGFLIMVCVGIYAVLIQSVAFNADIIGSLWRVMGFTVLLAFTLFKTGAVAKSILHAH